jgi:hypothetical protein
MLNITAAMDSIKIGISEDVLHLLSRIGSDAAWYWV